MRIHRIKLANYGGVDACEVTLDDEGVTIIEGQNEVGKTSLLEAVDLIIDYPDSSGAGPVKAIKPVDRDDGAEAEIEVSTGPYRFTYRKRWHRQRLTELRIVEPRREQLTGREAHDRVKVMLEETLDEALWEALRLHQGGQLAQGAFGEGESLGRALDQTAGGEVGDGRENDLWSRVQDERAKYWTATGLPKGKLTTIEAELVASRSRVDELVAELRALDADAEAVARLSDNASLLEERARDSEAEEKRLQACEEAIDRYRAEVRRLEVEREALTAKHELRAGAAARRTDLIARVDELAAAADAADDELERAGPVRRAAEAHDAQVHAELEQARRLLETAEVDHQQADADETFRRQEIELAQLSERHDRIIEAQERLSRAEAVLDATLVDDALLDRIVAANLELVGAEAAAASGAVAVEARALSEVELQIDGSPHALTEGETTETVVTDSASIVIQDLVRLEVRAGSEAQNLAEQVAGARASLAALCEQAGVSDVDAAQAANRARQDAERTKDEASATIQQDLRDLTLASLAQKASRLTERTSSYEADRTHPSEVPADFEAAKALAAEAGGRVDRSAGDGRPPRTGRSDRGQRPQRGRGG